MASTLEFVEYVCGQSSGAGDCTARKMFGEYGIYLRGKFIGVICANQFFVKPTQAGQKVCPGISQAPPYEGAKPYFLVNFLEEPERLTRLLNETWEELPFPKPKKKKETSI